MSAPQKVSNVQVREAWQRYGRVGATAEALGISRGALAKRMQALGIDPAPAPPPAAPSDLPIPALRPRSRVVRVERAQAERLWSAARRLGAAFGVETDASLLLNRFLEEKLDGWVEEKAALAKTWNARGAEA